MMVVVVMVVVVVEEVRFAGKGWHGGGAATDTSRIERDSGLPLPLRSSDLRWERRRAGQNRAVESPTNPLRFTLRSEGGGADP